MQLFVKLVVVCLWLVFCLTSSVSARKNTTECPMCAECESAKLTNPVSRMLIKFNKTLTHSSGMEKGNNYRTVVFSTLNQYFVPWSLTNPVGGVVNRYVLRYESDPALFVVDLVTPSGEPIDKFYFSMPRVLREILKNFGFREYTVSFWLTHLSGIKIIIDDNYVLWFIPEFACQYKLGQVKQKESTFSMFSSTVEKPLDADYSQCKFLGTTIKLVSKGVVEQKRPANEQN